MIEKMKGRIKKNWLSDIFHQNPAGFVCRFDETMAEEPAMLAIEVSASNFCARETRGTKARLRTLAETCSRASNNSAVPYMFQKPTNLTRSP